MKTYSAKADEVARDWFLVDAKGLTLGRMATEIARRLRGKHKTIYTPHVDTGDYIVVINAAQVTVTGKKFEDKVYYRLVGVRALKTPLNAHVQGGLSDDDPAEYPMTLTVRALPPEERAKRLRELLSSFDERKKKYAEALLSEK